MRSASQEQGRSIAFCTELLGLLRHGFLTTSELEAEIVKHDLLFKGAVRLDTLQWLQVQPPVPPEAGSPRRGQDHAAEGSAGVTQQEWEPRGDPRQRWGAGMELSEGGGGLSLSPSPQGHGLSPSRRCSLFQRMINEIPHVQLLCQHRMRPEISQLLVPFFYKALRDHPAVSSYEKVKGVESSVFFIQHAGAEDLSGQTGSYSNCSEAAFLVHPCKYPLEQGYAKGHLTVLTPYSSQMATIRQLLARRDMAKVAACTVDDFQGEESDIVLLSLVRSNPEGRIGFLGDRHRVCVAFSHAKKGFYCVGELEGIAWGAGGRLWAKILATLKNKGLVGDGLVLTCQNHPEATVTVRDDSNFMQSPEGGRTCRCWMPLPCSHPCPRHCHPRDHEHRRVRCCLPCARPPCERGHPCPKLCWAECGPCLKKVEKVLPRCGHWQRRPCHVPAERWRCQEPCPRPLAYGHPCPRRCRDDCGGDDCGGDYCHGDDYCGDDCGGAVEGVLPCNQPACTQQELPAACQESGRQSPE